ncbi:MAG: glycosyltransferase family 4 protein [Alkalinema sp. FL-bin-369]|nr:glycosyltransferase family 4 protein [Leptolyngbyaceae cyanobacterium LF-bin-369]
MKILIASHSYIVDLNCEKFRILAQLAPDIEVTIVVPKRWCPGGVMKGTIEAKPWQDGNFRVVPVSNFSTNNQGALCFGTELIQLLKSFRPDIIQVEQGAKSLAYAQMITLNTLLGLKAKNVFFTWWNLPYTLKIPIARLEKYNLDHTDGIIVGNKAGYTILRDKGFDRTMRVMPQLGVDEELFKPQDSTALRSSFGIQPNDFVIGFVGRFVPEKGLHTLLDAVAILNNRNRSFKLLLLGRGEMKAELLNRAQKLGIGDRMVQLDSVKHNEVAQYISAMNTLVLPSETTLNFKTLTSVGWQEQFGHVLIEAMAAQVPVIGSDSGEIPNVIADTGLVFPEGDATALAHHLCHLIDDRTFAENLGRQGYQRCIAKYTNQALAKETLEFYRSL